MPSGPETQALAESLRVRRGAAVHSNSRELNSGVAAQ